MDSLLLLDLINVVIFPIAPDINMNRLLIPEELLIEKKALLSTFVCSIKVHLNLSTYIRFVFLASNILFYMLSFI